MADIAPAFPRSPTLIVVLGMHRSGTSVLTRAMETMGAEFGTHLLPAVKGDNDKGYFEDADVNAVNMEVLHAAGADWDTMAPIDLDAIDVHTLDALRVKAAAMLRAKCEGRFFAVKDPRIARLLPFWQPIFANLQSRVIYAIAVRNPISVARSLAKRGEFAEEKAHILWLAHTVAALDATADTTRTVIGYDALLDVPRAELERVSAELGLPLIEARLDAFEREFLDDSLRHTRYASQDFDLVHSASRQAKALFAALDASIRGGLPADNPGLAQAVGNARTYLEDIEPLLRYEWQLDQQRRSALPSAEAHHLRQAELDDLRQTNSALEDQLAAARAELARARMLHTELESARHLLRAELDNAKQLLNEVFGSTSWRATAPLRSFKRWFAGR